VDRVERRAERGANAKAALGAGRPRLLPMQPIRGPRRAIDSDSEVLKHVDEPPVHAQHVITACVPPGPHAPERAARHVRFDRARMRARQ